MQDNSPTFYTRPQQANAYQWHTPVEVPDPDNPGQNKLDTVDIPGVFNEPIHEMHYKFFPTVSASSPAVKTPTGWETVKDGDWIVTNSDGSTLRIPNDQFHQQYVTLEEWEAEDLRNRPLDLGNESTPDQLDQHTDDTGTSPLSPDDNTTHVAGTLDTNVPSSLDDNMDAGDGLLAETEEHNAIQ